ncbi:hypothetical protein [Jiella pelagia]|uniref:Uncharacterized protein n=1 Tax=Jiella pelagia TaxID=2986949 RepID=A0ABY7BUS2_9HYPH|nr:hypothetical protein [Jiella pelagia]WAP67209.1 hypothetical protein OH818_16665 [Jiella pelagia]
MLLIDEKKFAIADANERLKALIDLTKFNDTQAMGLFRLYVTLGVTALGAAAAIAPAWGSAGWAAVVGLTLFGISILVGAIQCHRAMIPGDVPFPGRDAKWWMAVRDSETWSFEAALDEYIDDAAIRRDKFLALHIAAAGRLTWARRFAYVSAMIGVAAAVGVSFWTATT